MKEQKGGNPGAADATCDKQRRRFFTQILALTGSAAASPAVVGGLLVPTPAAAQAPIRGESYGQLIVQTTGGAVRGASRNGVVCFKGIPYAGSPAGENRFKAPPPLKPWSGVRDALVYGPASIQPLDPNRPKTLPMFPTSEDCLFLNVWTPSFWDGQKRPVMFYSHGGGFVTGNGGAEAPAGIREFSTDGHSPGFIHRRNARKGAVGTARRPHRNAANNSGRRCTLLHRGRRLELVRNQIRAVAGWWLSDGCGGWI